MFCVVLIIFVKVFCMHPSNLTCTNRLHWAGDGDDDDSCFSFSFIIIAYDDGNVVSVVCVHGTCFTVTYNNKRYDRIATTTTSSGY